MGQMIPKGKKIYILHIEGCMFSVPLGSGPHSESDYK